MEFRARMMQLCTRAISVAPDVYLRGVESWSLLLLLLWVLEKVMSKGEDLLVCFTGLHAGSGD